MLVSKQAPYAYKLACQSSFSMDDVALPCLKQVACRSITSFFAEIEAAAQRFRRRHREEAKVKKRRPALQKVSVCQGFLILFKMVELTFLFQRFHSDPRGKKKQAVPTIDPINVPIPIKNPFVAPVQQVLIPTDFIRQTIPEETTFESIRQAKHFREIKVQKRR